MQTLAQPNATATSQPPKLMDRVRESLRAHRYALSTERTYCHWIKRFIFFHGKLEILQSWINPPAGQMGLPQGPWHRHLVALGAQRAELARLLQAFLAIDDWTDGSIAPPELIAETKAALAALEAA